jgi:uncharacterized protein
MTHIAPEFPPERHWRDALAEGRFLLQRDPVNGQHYFPPRLVSPSGGLLEWAEIEGLGTVYSTTTVQTRPPAEPYNVALIDLAEGPRLMSRVEGIAAPDVAIGMAVKAQIAERDGISVLVFHPV